MQVEKSLSQLEQLPTNIIGDIISWVALLSRSTVRHVMQASPVLTKCANDIRVYKNINLKPLAMHPLSAMNKYTDLMEKCLSNDNLEAHYIKGIQEYFQKNNTNLGLQHLKKAAEGSYTNGMYLYGIIMLCRNQMEEGKTYLDKMEWKENKSKADRCWREIKRSLHSVRVRRLECYSVTLQAIRPTIMCNRDDLENRCVNCYYYKQMVKFVYFI